ncbi:MAG TPA: hypothetical protein DCE42_13905 [Myxococcales bacterium]|nr:hypothetical protein [Deltaproteobacteria bacterium]MBU50969.1 hypothetical protein [Deltaproteobacteria bacterium]HAA55852.1 hypothetical protein [Myxococcales bacterium]|tara:strand:- start:2734 stop:4206 length:1473 start_codon:yes stop_codon:yes gene_type:complete
MKTHMGTFIWLICLLFVPGSSYAEPSTKKKTSKESSTPSKAEIEALRKAFQKTGTKKQETTNNAQKKKGKASKTTKDDPLSALRNAFKNAGSSTTNTQQPQWNGPGFAVQSGQGGVQQRRNLMNPAISALGVFAAGWSSHPGNGHCHADGVCHGDVGIFGHSHDPSRTGLNLQQLELVFEAAVDPYFTAAIVLSLVEVDGGFELEIEEAYMQSLALPFSLQLKAGRYLSHVSRLASMHLHSLDFMTISLPVMFMIGGEMSHNAAELSWLAPTPFFLRFAAEASYGGSIAYGVTDPSIPMFSGQVRAFFDLPGGLGLQIGGAVAQGVWDRRLSDASDLKKTLFTGHMLWRWRPPQSFRYQELKVMAEYIGMHSQCDVAKTDSSKPQYRQVCLGVTEQDTERIFHGFTAKVIYRFAMRWQAGLRYEMLPGMLEPSARKPLERLSAMVHFAPTEFSQFRLQYDAVNLFQSAEIGHAVWLQLQFSIGEHGAHKY